MKNEIIIFENQNVKLEVTIDSDMIEQISQNINNTYERDST